MKIPEDLKQLYEEAEEGTAYAGNHDGDDPTCLPALIERIATLTEQLEERDKELAQARAENEVFKNDSAYYLKANIALERERDALRAQLEQMRRPVTDEEWSRSYWAEEGGMRGFVNSFIAARARRQEKP